MWLAGHIKVLDGPYVARGPEVVQAWSKIRSQYFKTAKSEIKLLTFGLGDFAKKLKTPALKATIIKGRD